MPGFLSPGKGVPLLLIPEYSGINKDQRIPDRSETAHRKPLVKCFLTLLHFHPEALQFLFSFCCKSGESCISEVVDISPGNLDSSLCFTMGFPPFSPSEILLVSFQQYGVLDRVPLLWDHSGKLWSPYLAKMGCFGSLTLLALCMDFPGNS